MSIFLDLSAISLYNTVKSLVFQHQFQMKKILFVITQSEFGGAQRFLDTLVSHLPQNEYQILIATGSNGDGQFLSHLHKHGFATHKLAHLVRQPHPYNDFLAISELRSLIKKFQPDTLFLCSSKAGVIGSVAANWPTHLPGLRVIYRIGGWSFNDPQPQWKKSLWIQIERKTAKYKDVIIVNNKHDFDQAKHLRIKPRGTLELVYNGLDSSEINFLSSEEARQKLGLSDQDFVIGTIANFYPTKGLTYLIEAMAILSHKLPTTNYKLLIIGDGEERNKLQAQIQQLGLNHRVILYGRLDDARSYLKVFDAYVLPSVKEGFPWAILEAMRAGLPVIATRVGAIPEVIQDGQNGLLIEPRNPAQLAQKLEQLLADEQLRISLSTHALQTISEHFSLSKMLQQIKTLL